MYQCPWRIVEFNYVYAEKTTEERGSRDVETRCPFNRKTKLEQEIINGFFLMWDSRVSFQILEEVCLNQGFQPVEEYNLRFVNYNRLSIE